MDTTAEVTLEKVADGFAITAVHLMLKAKIPGADQGEVRRACGQGEGGLSGVQAAQHQDHAGCVAGGLNRRR
jgi:organic hydroperoxide reductase OsmC/OhrA